MQISPGKTQAARQEQTDLQTAVYAPWEGLVIPLHLKQFVVFCAAHHFSWNLTVTISGTMEIRRYMGEKGQSLLMFNLLEIVIS